MTVNLNVANNLEACCAEGVSRRSFIKSAGSVLATIGIGSWLSACSSATEATTPVVPSGWQVRKPAPFFRHAHSGAASGGKLLVMGDRRGIDVRAGDVPSLGEPQQTIQIVSDEFRFGPSQFDVPEGVPVRIILRNEGSVEHDLVVPGAGVYVRANPGESAEVVAVLNQPELFFCSIGGHADVGMVGEISVDGVGPEQATIERSDGVTEMWWYDPSTDSYVRAADLPHAFDHVSFVALNDAVYSIGGYTGDIGTSRSDVWVLAPEANEWQRVADLPHPRGAMAASTDGIKIYCAGGRSDPEGTPSSGEVLSYDPSSDSWEVLATQLPTGRDHVAGAVVDDVFWVVGGRGDGRRVSSTPVTEGLDLRSGEWRVGSQVPVPESAGGVAAIDGLVLVFGGEGPASSPTGAAGRSYVTFTDVNAYDPATDRWSGVAKMPIGVHHPAYAVIEERLYTIGGGNRSGVSETDITQELALGV